jgi:hypothetical protein
MSLRSDTTLAVRYTEEGGSPRTLLFVALPGEVDDIIVQETGRRELLFKNLYDQGPVYTSSNYGTLAFSPDGTFTWSGYGLLVPQIIPYTAPGKGVVDMGLFLAPSLAAYDGAFSLIFSPGEPHAESGNGSGDPAPRGGPVRAGFIYTLDTQGFRIEYVPPDNLESSTVVRRSSSPTVIYFFRAAGPPPVSGER